MIIFSVNMIRVMIWEINKILNNIDEQKWKKLNKEDKTKVILELQILIAITYLIHLHLSGLPIKNQLHLLLKYYESEPIAFFPLTKYEVIELFFRFQPLIPIILYVNYVNQLQEDNQLQKDNKTKKRKLNTKKKSKRNKSMKGGYLFMLTSRGEKPIRGVDMEKFLEQMDEAVQSISYLPSSGPPAEGEQPNTYNAFALLYFLARNQQMNAAAYAMPYVGDYLNVFSRSTGARKPRGAMRSVNTMKYTNLLTLWSNLQKQYNKSESKKTMNEEFSDNYENFVKKYMGRKELREKKNEYQNYVEQLQKYKEKNDIEKKLFDAYEKAHPPKKDFMDKYGSLMSTLDQITMITSMI